MRTRTRRERFSLVPDLSGGNLNNADLRGADLSNCDLAFATLVGANLAGADLTEADLTMADLTDANLSGARLNAACLDIANLTRCDLRRASLVRTRLDGALLHDGVVDMTLFADCDLSVTLELESLRHQGPSIVGADTLARSGGAISQVFLQSAGVPPGFIDFVARNGSSEQPDAPIPHRKGSAHRVSAGQRRGRLAGGRTASARRAVLEPAGR